MLGHLFHAFKRRKESNEHTTLPARRNVRAVESVPPKLAPDPVRDGDFFRVGKANRGQPRMPIAAAMSIAAIQSVSEQGHGYGPDLIAPQHIAHVPIGRQLPHGERVNIGRAPAVAYGSLFQLNHPANTGLPMSSIQRPIP